MRSLIVSLAVALCARVLCAAPAAAQTATTSAEPGSAVRKTSTPAGAFTFAVGTDAEFDNVLGSHTRNVTAQLGYERRVGGADSPFALRLAGEYWRSGRTRFVESYAPEYTFWRTTQIVGGSLLGVYRLPTLGAVHPYALAGVGVYQYSGVTKTDAIPSAGTVVYRAGEHVNSVGYTAGLGASTRVGPADLFAEVRLISMPGLSSVSSHRGPLTLGARLPF